MPISSVLPVIVGGLIGVALGAFLAALITHIAERRRRLADFTITADPPQPLKGLQ